MHPEDRTTREVIETLGEDYARCHKALVDAIDRGKKGADGLVEAEFEFEARQLIRAAFAYIEAVTFSVKAWSAAECMENGLDITPEERYFAVDTEYEINDKGDVIERAARIPLVKNVRFAFSLSERARGLKTKFDPSVEWWSCFKLAVRIRDRLTHPKLPGDLDVSGDEIVTVMRAVKGFEEHILSGVRSAA